MNRPVKVIASKTSIAFEVVDDAFGEIRTWPNGVQYHYEPLPVCRVPIGYGRDEAQANDLAERICRLLNSDIATEAQIASGTIPF